MPVRSNSADRPVRVRQVDVPALPQPYERHHRYMCRVTGSIELDGMDVYSDETRCRSLARTGRHGFPKAKPVPKNDF